MRLRRITKEEIEKTYLRDEVDLGDTNIKVTSDLPVTLTEVIGALVAYIEDTNLRMEDGYEDKQ